MKNEFTLTVTIHAKAETIYKAWLSTEGHSAITGSPAKVDGTMNGDFTAWDGYIWGMFLELEENKRIVQASSPKLGIYPAAFPPHAHVLFNAI